MKDFFKRNKTLVVSVVVIALAILISFTVGMIHINPILSLNVDPFLMGGLFK